ncbi:MAG TPA: deoxynucleoside kinase [Vicinamibacteria bacterium]|nr:deoxynucleoside kinase [Vicinamibacteria bacterium]
MKLRYVSVEGPPGVGKTALVERLVAHLEASVVLERSENPFLRDFYHEKPGAAFQTQMFFLLSRYRQLLELAQRELFRQVTVSDFIFAKDKIFAYLNLDDTELMLYEKIYRVLEGEVPQPELVIYLQAPAEVLLKRLKARPRRAEPGPGEAYLRELVKAYDYFFFHYSATPLLVVNTAEVDFSHPATALDDLIHEMQSLSGGTRFYMPGRTR